MKLGRDSQHSVPGILKVILWSFEVKLQNWMKLGRQSTFGAGYFEGHLEVISGQIIESDETWKIQSTFGAGYFEGHLDSEQ